ncbi:permease [Anaerosalibacter bizertensis]|uniref:Permease n=1 Tax=Anaerosalibacter bizertensis TaxID=932217 RepID=A0A844FFJ8_9FIRM|nr:permease [Anaerosalibacter bizertensis]MBV1818445.1 permease [Bacteroidales bacterium MSK.15.36]MCG4581508.1 permease [Anaerosalibacter bizertensis]MSS42745.1 permease [Anaerosalibacter bizertensis]
MDIFTIALWVITGIWFVISMIKDSEKTLKSMKMSKKMMGNMIGQILGILFLIGLLLTFIPPHIIKEYLGSSNTIMATIISALVGSITLIPAFVAFPLVGSIVDMGASIVPAVAFLTTLTMVGFVTFNLEKQEFGRKFAIARNSLSFLAALLISMVMGAIL